MKLIYILCFLYFAHAIQVGTDSCSAFISEASCDASGYCYWEGVSCKSKPCYLINEIAACRTTSTTQTWNGILSATCTSVTDKQFNIQYDNVCYKISESQSNYAFIRFPLNMDGYPDASSDNTPLATLTSGISIEKMKKLFTVNLNTATSLTQVSNLLQAYISYSSLLVISKEAHPFYMEKILYQAFQYLRDYYYLRTEAMPPRIDSDRDAVLQKIDPIRAILMKRISLFSPNYYQTNYYLVNFAACPISRLSLTVNGQLHTVTTKVDYNDYNTKGYLSMMTYPGEQFGRKGLSDVIWLAFYDTSFSTIVSQPFTLIWTWSDPNLSVVTGNVKLYQFSLSTPTIASTVTCTSATKQCSSGVLTTQGAYYFSYSLDTCASLDENNCRLRYGCTWNTSSCS